MNKALIRNLGILIIALISLSCDGRNTCDDGFVVQYGPDGSTFCIPEYEEGLLNDFNFGDSYFHEKHGVIRYEKGDWKNISNRIVVP